MKFGNNEGKPIFPKFTALKEMEISVIDKDFSQLSVEWRLLWQ
jgi:hypothetical protein